MLVALLARMVGGDQMLAPVLDPFHRPAEPHRRDADQHVLRIEFAADAEAAADMAFEQMDDAGGGRPSMRASVSRLRCGTLAAPCSSSMSREAS